MAATTFLPAANTAAAHFIRRILIADFILFVLSFLAYIVQFSHQRKVLLVNSNELNYNHPTLVRIRNWRYGSVILNHGAATVLSMVVVTVLGGYYRKVLEILIWIITGFFILWAVATAFKRHHLVDMVFSIICLGIYAAVFGIIFAHTI